MADPRPRDTADRGRHGSALVIALIVSAVLAVLGLTFLALAGTEGRIAANEERVDQARFAAGSALALVKTWFDRPGTGTALIEPLAAAIDRSLRRIEDDGDPATPPVPQDGARWPRYKQGIDLDADGADDLFRPPYRGGVAHELSGTEDGPDLRIDAAASIAAAAFLDDLSDRLFADFPRRARGIRARVRRIDVYGPPWVRTAGTWLRHGIGSVRVDAVILRRAGAAERIVGHATTRAVLEAVSYGRSVGPLRSCAGIEWPAPDTIRWGAVVADGPVTLSPDHRQRPSSWPRALSATPRVDLLWGHDDDPAFLAYRGRLEADAQPIEDPWLRWWTSGPITGAPAAPQPYPFVWNPTPPDPLGDETRTHHAVPGEDGNHANLFHNLPAAPCAAADYPRFKAIATSGGHDVRHFVWAGGTTFREGGAGPAREFRDLTDGATGLLFFDTADRSAPRDDDGDGRYDNLTPAIRIVGGTWSVRGALVVHAESLLVDGARGRPVVTQAPGEPFQDRNADGRFDPGEAWVNLAYPGVPGGAFVVDATDNRRDDGTLRGLPVRNRRGPPVVHDVVLWGWLRTAGRFESRGAATWYGSLRVESGVVDPGTPGPSPVLLWDADLGSGWPPPALGLPRVVITGVEP
jgi:hypothetical protein